MVKTFTKTILRRFKANIMRMTAVSVIIAIGVGVVTAIGTLPTKIRDSLAGLTNPRLVAEVGAVADKIEIIGAFIPIFFIIICALTALTTITRLVEEERAKQACLKTLGYSNAAIVFAYVAFAFVCSFLGCMAGLFSGNYLLSPVLFDAVKMGYEIPSPPDNFYMTLGLLWSLAMTAAVTLTAFLVGWKNSEEIPAALLRPKAPKAGKKIWLEKVGFVWKPLPFKYKSSIRNILRDKGRLIMTVLSVAGATALIFCGLGLFTSLNSFNDNSHMSGVVDAIIPISIALTLCAVALAVLVLFNLTNISIEERRREIATLKVLGYNQNEVSGFIFREVMMLSFLGIILGLPAGNAFTGFLFEYMDIGYLSNIEWYVWVLAAAVSILSVFITDVLLYPKINRIEMIASLKTME